MGALQEISQATMARPLCRRTEQVSHQRRVLPALAAAAWTALGGDGPTGPAYVDFPTDLLREPLADAVHDAGWITCRGPSALRPDPGCVAEAAALLTRSRRPVVVAGRVRHLSPTLLARFLDETDAMFVAQSEARALLATAGAAAVPGAKGRALAEADLVITLGCRLNFQLAYGSPAVISPAASLIRVGRSQDDLVDNRPADVELQGDVAAALGALVAIGVSPKDPDRGWREYLRTMSAEREARLKAEIADARTGSDGRMHPYRLLDAVGEFVEPHDVVVADGGDILSFARVALPPTTLLDSGAFGCLGVGIPFAIAAALVGGTRPVVCITGDGAFGFHAMELDTASRTGAPVLVVVANNEAWNIERADQLSNWSGHIAGTELPGCRYDQLANALGVHGVRVDDPGDLREALRQARDHLPALVDVAVTRDAESPDFRAGLPNVPDHHALATWDKVERQLTEQSVATSRPVPAG
jgi:acetolactate synthase-1/2/3 large subunit